MRVRAAIAVAFVTLLGVAAACRFTDGLTGGPADDASTDDASPEGGDDCDADLTRSTENCGACGNVCPPAPNGFPGCVDAGCVFACAASYGDCDDSGANGCETNIGNSRTSCGKCGHDCLGGGCSSGACQPVALGTDQQNAPIHFVIDATYIYGVNAYGTVTRRLKNGSSTTILANGDTTVQWPPPRIALYNGTLFYTTLGPDAGDASGGTVGAVSMDGGPPVVIADGSAPFAIAAAGGYVVWSESTPPPETSAIRLCKLAARPDGGGPVASCASITTAVSSEPGAIESVALHPVVNGKDVGLYYTNMGRTNDTSVAGLRTCDLPVCAPVETLVPIPPIVPFGLTNDTNAVVWTTRNGSVQSCGYPCSSAETFDTYQYSPRFVAIDSQNAFWTNSDGTIRTVQRTASSARPRVEQTLVMDGPPEQRAQYLWDIAVDNTAVYWSKVNPSLPLGGSVLLQRLAR